MMSTARSLPESVSLETLETLCEAGSVRTLKAVRNEDSWAVVARIGMTEKVLRSAREPVRHWKKLDTLYRFASELGVHQIEIHGA